MSVFDFVRLLHMGGCVRTRCGGTFMVDVVRDRLEHAPVCPCPLCVFIIGERVTDRATLPSSTRRRREQTQLTRLTPLTKTFKHTYGAVEGLLARPIGDVAEKAVPRVCSQHRTELSCRGMEGGRTAMRKMRVERRVHLLNDRSLACVESRRDHRQPFARSTQSGRPSHRGQTP